MALCLVISFGLNILKLKRVFVKYTIFMELRYIL